MKNVIVLVALSMCITESSAGQRCAPENTQACAFSIYGYEGIAGNGVTCGSFVENAENEIRRDQQKIYIAGYISASNYHRARFLDIDIDGAYRWTLNYCQAHPLDSAISAIVKLDKQLGQGNAKVYTDDLKTKSQ